MQEVQNEMVTVNSKASRSSFKNVKHILESKNQLHIYKHYKFKRGYGSYVYVGENDSKLLQACVR